MLDLSEPGRQIAEKLFVLLDARQRRDFMQYVLDRADQTDSILCDISESFLQMAATTSLTEIREGNLYLCLEERKVCVAGQEIELTAKEFDIFALLIMNPNRVFTYEMIMDIVWHEDYDYYSRKAINNHVSNLRRKLKITPDIPDYIKSVHSIGYKFIWVSALISRPLNVDKVPLMVQSIR